WTLIPGSRLDADHPENGVLIPCRNTRRSNTVDATEAAEHDRKIRKAAIEISVPRGVPLMVVSTAVERRGDDTWLEIQTDRGGVAVLLERHSATLQEAGQAHFGRLTTACGVRALDDSSELHGKLFMIVGDTIAGLVEMDAA
ncbi:hypothetical protein, partial [Bradyrhizobium liaoningense]|uniref:hypothetical protein n=1 Tax=Bradyrhizobium liaoningense TaxID=43992 RepID=UPI001BA8C223